MSEKPETGMSLQEEQELVQRCRSGEVEPFGRVVEAYETRIRLLIFGVIRDRQTADDLCQETFIKAFRSLDRFQGRSSLYTWLYRIAINLALDYRRWSQRHPWMELDENRRQEREVEAWPGAGTSRFLLRDEVQRLVWEGMEKLSPVHRTTLILREWEELDYRRIARVMKCSVGTVMSRLFYARKRLKELLQDRLTDG